MTSLIILTVLLLTSAALNAFLIYRLFHLKKHPPKTYSVELQEFCADLFSSGAILAIGRVDPSQIMMRSLRSTRG